MTQFSQWETSEHKMVVAIQNDIQDLCSSEHLLVFVISLPAKTTPDTLRGQQR